MLSLRGSPPRGGGCCGLCEIHKSTELAHFFLFCSCVYFCLYGPFNCISFHKFSQRLSAFSLCFSGLISALLVLSTTYLFVKVSLSPDIIICGWLGLKHQTTTITAPSCLSVTLSNRFDVFPTNNGPVLSKNVRFLLHLSSRRSMIWCPWLVPSDSHLKLLNTSGPSET